MLRAHLRVTVDSFSIEGSLEALGLTLLEGDNGAGKTTLLRALLGVVPNVEGRLECEDRVLLDTETRTAVPTEERRFGYVPQRTALLPHLDVRSNLQFSLEAFRVGWSVSTRREKLEAALDRFALRGFEKAKASSLSGGERQKVALARALVIEPSALLLDEPFSALDADAKSSLGNTLAEHLENFRIPAVLVNHGPLPMGLTPSGTFWARAGRLERRVVAPSIG